MILRNSSPAVQLTVPFAVELVQNMSSCHLVTNSCLPPPAAQQPPSYLPTTTSYRRAGDQQPPATAQQPPSYRPGIPGVASGGASATDAPVEADGNRRRAKLRYWHASTAKNTSHMFAISSEIARRRRPAGSLPPTARLVASASSSSSIWAAEPPNVKQVEAVLRNLALINCDCDNVFDDEFVVGTLEALMAARQVSAASVQAAPPLCPAAYASGDQACLTGRVAYWASDFLRIGGYDEEPGVVGSGYQDRDICLRLQKATGNSGAKRGLPLTKSVGLGVKNRIGATTKEDRGPIKVENCNPNDLDIQKTWSSFNAHNTKRMLAKTARGDLVRNLTGSFGGGAPNLNASLLDLWRECAASTGAFWVVTEANRSQQDVIVICYLITASRLVDSYLQLLMLPQPAKASKRL